MPWGGGLHGHIIVLLLQHPEESRGERCHQDCPSSPFERAFVLHSGNQVVMSGQGHTAPKYLEQNLCSGST